MTRTTTSDPTDPISVAARASLLAYFISRGTEDPEAVVARHERNRTTDLWIPAERAASFMIDALLKAGFIFTHASSYVPLFDEVQRTLAMLGNGTVVQPHAAISDAADAASDRKES